MKNEVFLVSYDSGHCHAPLCVFSKKKGVHDWLKKNANYSKTYKTFSENFRDKHFIEFAGFKAYKLSIDTGDLVEVEVFNKKINVLDMIGKFVKGMAMNISPNAKDHSKLLKKIGIMTTYERYRV